MLVYNKRFFQNTIDPYFDYVFIINDFFRLWCVTWPIALVVYIIDVVTYFVNTFIL